MPTHRSGHALGKRLAQQAATLGLLGYDGVTLLRSESEVIGGSCQG